MMKKIIYTLSVVLTSLSVFGQDSYNNDDNFSIENDTVKKTTLKEIILIGSTKEHPVNVGKASIKPMDLPQASAVITSETLKT